LPLKKKPYFLAMTAARGIIATLGEKVYNFSEGKERPYV
jgi:hypothetical protein